MKVIDVGYHTDADIFISVTRDEPFLKEFDKAGHYYRLTQPLSGRPDVFPETIEACSTRAGTERLAMAVTPDLWSWCRVAMIARQNDREACTVLYGGHFPQGGRGVDGEFHSFGWLSLMVDPFYLAKRAAVLARLEVLVERDDPWDVVPVS